jgi:hypothetical protein
MYSTAYLTHCELIKTVALKYLGLGMTMTAIGLYEQVGMLEECMDGLIGSSYKEKAQALAAKYQAEHGMTPRLLCILGDLESGDKCLEYYTKAW